MRAALVALLVALFALAGQAHARNANNSDRWVAQPGDGPELRPPGDGGADRRGGAVHRPLDQEVEGIHQTIRASRRAIRQAREGVTTARQRLKDLRSQALAAAERARTVHARAQPILQAPREQEIRHSEAAASDRPADPEPPGPSGESDGTTGTDASNSAQSRHCHDLALADWIGSSPVECSRKDMDRYGRMVAVGLQVSVDPGTWMVREGWALAYRAYGSNELPQKASVRWPLALRRSSIAHTIAH
jgi:hypothetical protein